MARFNTRSTTGTTSPVITPPVFTGVVPGRTGIAKPNTVTALGGAGFTRDPRSELFLLAVSSLVSEGGNHHESAPARDSRMVALIGEVAGDAHWVRGFVRFLREVANLRTVSMLVAAHAVKIRLDAGIKDGHSTGIIRAAIARADEPGEFLALWRSLWPGTFPKPVKHGVEAAVVDLYSQRTYLKWDSEARSFRFADVISLLRPRPKDARQDALFSYILDERYKGKAAELRPGLDILAARRAITALNPASVRELTAGQLDEAAVTWESYSALLQGPMDAAAWEKVIPLMGYMALLRNLRNFDQAGISRSAERLVQDRLTDPAEVARSRQLPFRFLSAYRATHDGATVSSWPKTIEQALNLALGNVPSLSGRTLVLVDLSGSMYESKLSDNSGLRYVDVAASFGAALALRANAADLYGFGWEAKPYPFKQGDSLLPLTQRLIDTQVDGGPVGYHGRMFDGLGGTETPAALRSTFRPGLHDRIVIVTDEQYGSGGMSVAHRLDVVNDLLDQFAVPTYTWNLAGYRAAQAVSGSNKRHTFGGLSDSSFRLIPLLEEGRSQNWDDLFAVPLQVETV